MCVQVLPVNVTCAALPVEKLPADAGLDEDERAHRVLVDVADEHAADFDVRGAAAVGVDLVEDRLLEDDLPARRLFARAEREFAVGPVAMLDGGEVLLGGREGVRDAAHDSSNTSAAFAASGPRTASASPASSKPIES
jgi:hypothetical protein